MEKSFRDKFRHRSRSITGDSSSAAATSPRGFDASTYREGASPRVAAAAADAADALTATYDAASFSATPRAASTQISPSCSPRLPPTDRTEPALATDRSLFNTFSDSFRSFAGGLTQRSEPATAAAPAVAMDEKVDDHTYI